MERVLSLGAVRGVLLDVHGVLYNSGSPGAPIPGSVAAVQRLQDSHVQLAFCSNETSTTQADLVVKLRGFGFRVEPHQIFTPGPAVARLLRKEQLRPFLLIHPKLQSEFEGLPTTEPNCVVVGDAGEAFTFHNLNAAFAVLLKTPRLFSMGMGKYYMTTKGLNIDLGAYTKALEYAADCTAEVVGKPAPAFFQSCLDDLKLAKEEVVMVGDDIISDVGGAQKFGMRGVCVRTGKWRPEWETHPTVTPDAKVKDLAEFVDLLLNK